MSEPENVNHTPGPWTIGDTSIVTDDYCIAVIEDDGGYEAPGPQRKANARLIAASPDLLAACESFRKAMRHRGDIPLPTEFCRDLVEALGLAIMAVEKAKGEQTS